MRYQLLAKRLANVSAAIDRYTAAGNGLMAHKANQLWWRIRMAVQAEARYFFGDSND